MKFLKFESSENESLTVCFEPLCNTIDLDPDHLLSVPIVGDINHLSIMLSSGQITIWEPGDVLNIEGATIVHRKSLLKNRGNS